MSAAAPILSKIPGRSPRDCMDIGTQADDQFFINSEGMGFNRIFFKPEPLITHDLVDGGDAFFVIEC